MNRTRRAMILAGFQYAQLGLALVTGVILFPLTIRALGAHDYGLWLASGEIVGYLMLGDLGIFAVLPWLVAARNGAGDQAGIARLAANGLTAGVTLALVYGGVAAILRNLDPARLSIDPGVWETVSPALVVIIGLNAAGSAFRHYPAILSGLQDVVFCGLLSLTQVVMTVALTISLVILGGYGLVGLAIATALPPALGGVAAAVRVAFLYPHALGLLRPSFAGVTQLAREGFGPWLAGFGWGLVTRTTSIILVSLGRPLEATRLAATMKAAQLLQTFAWVLPDSTLIGLSETQAAGNTEKTRRVVLTVLVMYMLMSGFVMFAMLAANPALVRVWLGADLYAGVTVNAIIATNILFGAAVTGLFKVVAVGGYRPVIGIATLVYGVLSAGLSYALGRVFGVAGVIAGPTIASVVFAIPVGLWLLPKVYTLTAAEVGRWWLAWSLRSAPFLIGGGVIGWLLAERPIWCFVAAAVLGLSYMVGIRPLLAVVPWPATARRILVRLRLIPAEPAERLA